MTRIVLLCTALAACGWIKDHAAPTSSMSKVELYYIAPLPAGQTPQDIPTDRMQQRFGAENDVVVVYYDDSRTCEHYEEIDISMVDTIITGQGDMPQTTCAPQQPHNAANDIPYTGTGRGYVSAPMTDSTWQGSTGGGCGTFATAVCNRILQLTPPDQAITKDEWNGIATAIKQDADGGSSTSDQMQYYKDKGGYCAHYSRFDGDGQDYNYIATHIDRCDLKLSFGRKSADGKSWEDSHVETITSVDYMNKSMVTNSWGYQATITGGYENNFNHSRDGMNQAFHQADGSKLWPASTTGVWLETICPCNQFGDAASFLDTATL